MIHEAHEGPLPPNAKLSDDEERVNGRIPFGNGLGGLVRFVRFVPRLNEAARQRRADSVWYLDEH